MRERGFKDRASAILRACMSTAPASFDPSLRRNLESGLIQLALDRGGEDNVTVVIGRLKNKPALG